MAVSAPQKGRRGTSVLAGSKRRSPESPGMATSLEGQGQGPGDEEEGGDEGEGEATVGEEAEFEQRQLEGARPIAF